MNVGNRIAPPRFILFFAALIATAAFAWSSLPVGGMIVLSFDVAASIFLLACLPLLNDKADEMRKAALENDANRIILLILTVILTLAVLVAIADKLAAGNVVSGAEKAEVAATLALAWTFGNAVYALHYAHLYYRRQEDGRDRGGLDFPGDHREPDYTDFLYFSFTLGVALQTSDVCITSSGMRRVVIGHCVAAFVYNLGILALAINILAR